MSSSKQKNKLFLLLLLLASCASNHCQEECLDIPCTWHSPLQEEPCTDPACFRWWEAFQDPLLTSLIEYAACHNSDVRLSGYLSKEHLLQTINTISADIAKNYIQLRGLQQQDKILQAQIDIQHQLITLEEGLFQKGYLDSFDSNVSKKNLNSLSTQQSQIRLLIQKTLFHLSTLIGSPPGDLSDTLSTIQPLPPLPCDMPIDSPLELLQRHPSLDEARRAYDKTPSTPTFLNYKKEAYQLLEEVESALADYFSSLDKLAFHNNSNDLEQDNYDMIQDLTDRGPKDERDLLKARQAHLAAESDYIQAHVDALLKYVALYQALSTGWEACKPLAPAEQSNNLS
jgi:outer membrane protein TolC